MSLIARNRCVVTGVCGLVFMLAIATSPGRCADCEDCGIQSLFALYSLETGVELSRDQQSMLLKAYPGGDISMLDIKQAAQTIGISLRGVGGDLAELAKLPGAKILHLRNPDHFSVLAMYRPGLAQLVDSTGVAIMPEEELGKRYTGHALVTEAAERRDHSPKLELSGFAFGFGTAAPGSQLEFPFTLTNVGDQVLEVRPKDGCCGAPEVLLEKERVSPGESAECLLIAKPESRGNIVASRGVLTNDPDQPVVFLTVYGYVPPDVTVYPPSVFVGGEKGDALAASVLLRGPADLEVMSVSCKSQVFQATLILQGSDDRGARTWRIDLNRKPSTDVGEHKDELTLQLGGDRPALVVPLRARIRPELGVFPPQLFLGFVGPYQGVERDVTISSRHGREFAVLDARSDVPAISVGEPRESGGKSKWIVPVRVEVGQPGVVKGVITVSTDVTGEKHLVVPLYAHVVASGKGAILGAPSPSLGDNETAGRGR